MYSLKKSPSFRLCAKTILFLVVSLSSQEGVMCEQGGLLSTNEVGVTNVSKPKQQHGPTSFVSTGSGTPAPDHIASGSDEYRATYFYPMPHPVNWNRDSYADAANEFGYNQQQQQHHSSASVPGSVYAPAYGGESEGYEDGGFGGGALGGLGGLGGIAGILGIKGVKGLGLLGLAKIGIPILVVLGIGLLLLPLIFLFFPVPVITVPATTRSLVPGLNFGDLSGKMSNLARSVLESDKCIERISCEMSRVSRGSFIDKTLKRVIPRFEPHFPPALKRIARVYMEGQPACNKKYTCYLMDDNTAGVASSKNH